MIRWATCAFRMSCVAGVMLGLLTATARAQPESPEVAAYRAGLLRLADEAVKRDGLVIEGNDGWLLLAGELRHVGVGVFWGEQAAAVSKATRPELADPIPAIVDFHQQLSRRGIELLVVPVPAKVAVYPQAVPGLTAPMDRVDFDDRRFLEVLRDRGVPVLDLMETYLPARAGPLLYCRTDTHWSPRGCELAAKAIAQRLKSRPAVATGGPALELRPGSEQRSILGDLRLLRGETQGTREDLPARVIRTSQGQYVEEDRNSPILLLGDSHTLVFHAGGDLHGQGAGLADQLAAELGRAVDVMGVRGSGATPARINLARRSRQESGYLAGKRVVIWCFSVREFTEASGWSKVPLSP